MRVKGHSFFKRVDEMLERRGYYRKDIAPLLGCTDKNISAMFARGALPDIDRCKALAKFLDCSAVWLAWNEGHWDKLTEMDNELINAMKAVPDAPRGPLMEIAAYLTKLPAPKKIETPKQSAGLPNRLTLLERAITDLQAIQACMSPRDPLAILAESQELALWNQVEHLKKKASQPAPALEPSGVSGSLAAAPVRGPAIESRQLELASHHPPRI